MATAARQADAQVCVCMCVIVWLKSPLGSISETIARRVNPVTYSDSTETFRACRESI